VPTGYINTPAISLGGPVASAREVHVQSAGAMNSYGIEVPGKTPETNILDARVRQTGEYSGIAIFGPKATVADSDAFTAIGQVLDTEGFAETTRVLRTRLATEGGYVATIRSPDTIIDSSLLTGGSIGVEAYASFGDQNALTLSNDTIDPGSRKVAQTGIVAARARAEGPGSKATITMVNSIAVDEQAVEGNATASVTCNSSILPPQQETTAAGTVECGGARGNVFVPPPTLFPPGPDWHLLPGTPAVDSGSGGDALSGTDLDRTGRIQDGNGDGTAVIDRGAYELAPPGPQTQPISGRSTSFRLGKVKRNRRKGTAKLEVVVPAGGRIVLKGKKVKRAQVDVPRAGTFRVPVVPKRGPARKLKRRGSARVSIEVAYTPAGGAPSTLSKELKLIRKAKAPPKRRHG
jgi:hypothetical protein